MSISDELADCSYTQAPIMSLSWIPHPASSSYRFFTPQMNNFSSRKVQPNIPVANNDVLTLGMQSSRRRNANNRKISKSSYKHIPHKDKPPHLVARRNARERKRVQLVNSAFAKLRKCVPIENRNKRLSKVKTLHRAIEYINALQALLDQPEDSNMLSNNHMIYSRNHESNISNDEDDDRDLGEFNEFGEYVESDIEIVNKENKSQGWSVSAGYEPNYWSNISYEDDCPGNIDS